MELEKQIIEIAVENGASAAGIARVSDLKSSASHLIYTKMGSYDGVGTVTREDPIPDDQLFNWPDSAKSVLVIGLSHPRDKQELDWWDGRGTPGNRLLIDIMKRTQEQVEDKLKVNTNALPYYVEKGGVFLKDAAVLAGIGCIGKSNMLVTPSHGPRIRLRAMFLDAEMEPTKPVEFDPCADCKTYCRRVCPEDAIVEKLKIFDFIGVSVDLPARDGTYCRETCNVRMEKDIGESKKDSTAEQAPVKYCRRCEFVCPVGK